MRFANYFKNQFQIAYGASGYGKRETVAQIPFLHFLWFKFFENVRDIVQLETGEQEEKKKRKEINYMANVSSLHSRLNDR